MLKFVGIVFLVVLFLALLFGGFLLGGLALSFLLGVFGVHIGFWAATGVVAAVLLLLGLLKGALK